LIDELTQKGDIYYFESKPYTGVVFDVYERGQLKLEGNYKNGKKNGLWNLFCVKNHLQYRGNYENGAILNQEILLSYFNRVKDPINGGNYCGVCQYSEIDSLREVENNNWNYNVQQSLTAIGSGGWLGSGRNAPHIDFNLRYAYKEKYMTYNLGIYRDAYSLDYEFQEEKLTGRVFNLYSSGLIKVEQDFQQGHIHGDSKWYYKNGFLKMHCKYELGNRIEKESKCWDEQGRQETCFIYLDKNGNLNEDGEKIWGSQ